MDMARCISLVNCIPPMLTLPFLLLACGEPGGAASQVSDPLRFSTTTESATAGPGTSTPTGSDGFDDPGEAVDPSPSGLCARPKGVYAAVDRGTCGERFRLAAGETGQRISDLPQNQWHSVALPLGLACSQPLQVALKIESLQSSRNGERATTFGYWHVLFL